MIMKTIIPIFCLLLIIACSSDSEEDGFTLDGTNIAMADIAGNWNATRALFGTAATGPITEVDVVDDGGSVTLNIQANGQFTITINQVGVPSEVTTGRMRFDEDLLVIFFDDDPNEWEFFGIFHNEPNLSINGGNGSVEFDFDGDGVDEPANIDFAFERI